jgi:hypothetical protein
VICTTSDEKTSESVLRERADSGCCEDVVENLSTILNNIMPEPNETISKPDDEELTLDLDVIPPEVLEYARRELGETDEVKCRTIHELKEMIYGNTRLFF